MCKNIDCLSLKAKISRVPTQNAKRDECEALFCIFITVIIIIWCNAHVCRAALGTKD